MSPGFDRGFLWPRLGLPDHGAAGPCRLLGRSAGKGVSFYEDYSMMRRAVTSAFVLVIGAIAYSSSLAQIALPAPPPTAAVAAVRDAKKVFVLNGGEDGDFQRGYPYGANVCYAKFYTSLQQSGHFQLVL